MTSNVPIGLLIVYCALVVVASLAGGWLILLANLTHTRLQLAISFVAGLMLGIALLHFLPDSFEQLHSMTTAPQRGCSADFWSCFLCNASFIFITTICLKATRKIVARTNLRRKRTPMTTPTATITIMDTTTITITAMKIIITSTTCAHAHTLAEKSAKQLSWVGTALGLTLHSLVDGLALAAAVMAGRQRQRKTCRPRRGPCRDPAQTF